MRWPLYRTVNPPQGYGSRTSDQLVVHKRQVWKGEEEKDRKDFPGTSFVRQQSLLPLRGLSFLLAHVDSALALNTASPSFDARIHLFHLTM
jgi:hypothetical protein